MKTVRLISKNDKLWLRNTSRYPDVEVWPLAKAAYNSVARSLRPGQVMPRIAIKFTNSSRTFSGMAPWVEWEPTSHGQVKWMRILCRIGKPERFPVAATYPKFKDMPEYWCQTYREGIIHIIAHEMQHCLGSSGRKAGEFICELSAWDAVEYYRQNKEEIDGEISRGLETIAQREALVAARKADSKNPEIILAKKVQAAQAMLLKWQRKEKLAATKKRHYLRTYNRLQRRFSELTALPQAAK